MSFSFASIGHAFATGLSDVVKAGEAVGNFIAKVTTPANQAEVEALTALAPAPYNVVGVAVERGVFAVAGEVAGVIAKFEGAAAQKLADAGLDKGVIEDFEALIKSVPGLFAAAKAAPVTPAS